MPLTQDENRLYQKLQNYSIVKKKLSILSIVEKAIFKTSGTSKQKITEIIWKLFCVKIQIMKQNH